MQPLLNQNIDDVSNNKDETHRMVYTEEIVEVDGKNIEGTFEGALQQTVSSPDNLKGKINIMVQEGGTQTADVGSPLLMYNSFS